MSRLKDILSEPSGVTPTPGKFVCPECFSDDALSNVVRAHAEVETCSYCGKKSTKPLPAPLDEVAEHIFVCIGQRYEDAANGVGWDEGEYVGAETWDTWELIDSKVEVSDSSGDLLSDIQSALPAQTWSRTDPYGPLERDVMNWSWRDFCETVKHQRRFFFQDHLTPRIPRVRKCHPRSSSPLSPKAAEHTGSSARFRRVSAFIDAARAVRQRGSPILSTSGRHQRQGHRKAA